VHFNLMAHEMLVDVYELEWEQRRQTKLLLHEAIAGNPLAASGLTRIKRATGLRLIALGERLAGGRDGHVGNTPVTLRPASNGAH
jgi:hypothetical protein